MSITSLKGQVFNLSLSVRSNQGMFTLDLGQLHVRSFVKTDAFLRRSAFETKPSDLALPGDVFFCVCLSIMCTTDKI